MKGHQLRAWRKRMRLTIKEASELLGISTATYSRWEASREPLARYVGWACSAISLNIPEATG